MYEKAIKARNIGKKFSKSLKHVMKYGVQDIGLNVLGREVDSSRLRKGEFWAVEGLSFELNRGENLGLIGPNGSGKTTVLKMLNGIYMPDKGRIDIRGRVGALIQVGAGFHPMLSGRENIYVNGAILGMSKKEIDRKFDDIVQFADIGDFLDSPVRHYSSGMFVRLGFSVAIHCDPDILLVDEILAVGDVNFRKKCALRMKELEKSDVTIVFVTHDLGALRHVCDRAVCLRGGKAVYQGDLDGAISEYMAGPRAERTSGGGGKYIKNVTITDNKGELCEKLYTGGSYNFNIRLNYPGEIRSPVVGCAVYDNTGTMVMGVNTRNSGFSIDSLKGQVTVTVNFPFLNLIPDTYRVRTAFYDSSMGMIDDVRDALFFKVHSRGYSTGMIFPEHNWKVEYEG